MKIHNVILGTFFLLSIAGNIDAASFDCGKATSDIEKIICSNEELSKLDESLNKAYLKALERPDIRKQMIESQKQWLKNERNACKNAECLKKTYETRIKELGLSSYGIVIENPPKPTATPHFAVNDAECVACNLCVEVCPVENCITMVRQTAGVDPRTGRKISREYANWTTHPNNPMARAAE
jgi:uncharacterized protein